MNKKYNEIISIINKIAQGIKYHEHGLNERYLHHMFSRQIQNDFHYDLEFNNIELHPEWPTYKKERDNKRGNKVEFGVYSKKSISKSSDGYPGFIDFTYGNYVRPEIAIEFMLRYGWSKSEFKFNLLKLMDKRNEFKYPILVDVILRKGKNFSFPKTIKQVEHSMKNVKNMLNKFNARGKECKIFVVVINKDNERKILD